LRGNCFIGHGRTDAKAVASACQSALRAVQQDLVGAISRAIAATGDATGDPAEATI
jgi:fatty acid/phospholipid biosynthesis enzyme